MKKIIEYVGGTKGDMVCRFLNNMEPSLNNTGKTTPISTDLKLLDPADFTLKYFEGVLSENTYEYLPSHPLWITYDKRYVDLLEKYDYEILSIKFKPQHYITITIESILKNNLEHAMFNLDFIPDFAWKMRARTNDLFNGMTKHRTLLQYEELFLNFSIPWPRMDEWTSLVENSWCDYDKHGYREWKLPVSIKYGSNEYINNVERYLQKWKK